MLLLLPPAVLLPPKVGAEHVVAFGVVGSRVASDVRLEVGVGSRVASGDRLKGR